MCSLALLVSFVNVGYGHGCTGYWCDTCLPAKVHDAPGVGFDLTPSYGCASQQSFPINRNLTLDIQNSGSTLL
jgi:hypothetical protein